MKVHVHFNVYYLKFLTKCPFGLVANKANFTDCIWGPAAMAEAGALTLGFKLTNNGISTRALYHIAIYQLYRYFGYRIINFS